MLNYKVFLTGASGFIGSHIAESLIERGCQVMALRREQSDLWRCSDFLDKITWVTEDMLESKLKAFEPTIILHLAWEGIAAGDRQNWEKQFANLQLLAKLIRLGREMGVQKFIGFGSQAEYGSIEGRLDENVIPEPDSAYAIAKLAAQKIIELAFKNVPTHWYWLRIYSVFGPREDSRWFVPMIISRMLSDQDCELTACEQRYDYIYVKDLTRLILNVVQSEVDRSGIYNVSSNQSQSLKSVITNISTFINSKSKIKFGILPYRENQSMHIEGNCEKYHNSFGRSALTEPAIAFQDTIAYYRSHKLAE